MIVRLCVTFATLLVIGGCQTLNPPQPDDPAYAPVAARYLQAPGKRDGAIYQEGHNLVLFETIRAHRVGDILTVQLQERTEAQKRALSLGRKEHRVEMPNPTVLGLPARLPNGHSLGFDIQANRNFNGEGESRQNNQLTGNISVTVSDVLPNGNLVIRGEKWVAINQGDEFIRLRGIVRQADIRPDNTIPSNLIADARIAYSGKGQVHDSNVMGWLAKFFNTGLWAW